MLEEGDENMDLKLESTQEADDEKGEIDSMAAGEDTMKAEGAGRSRSERPKKAPNACPHTDKPYYAKVNKARGEGRGGGRELNMQ